jgi:hypothetical protein
MATPLDRDIDKLPPVDRWRLLRRLAALHPAVVRSALNDLGPAKQDITVRSWALREPATEGIAGES